MDFSHIHAHPFSSQSCWCLKRRRLCISMLPDVRVRFDLPVSDFFVSLTRYESPLEEVFLFCPRRSPLWVYPGVRSVLFSTFLFPFVLAPTSRSLESCWDYHVLRRDYLVL